MLVELAGVYGWCMMAIGALLGMLIGLKSHEDGWLGGYYTFSRRMLRLAHIASFALGGLTLLCAWNVSLGSITVAAGSWSVGLMMIGALLMPVVCLLSAWRKNFRHFSRFPH
ncbi:MAG: hypothetical protein Kow00107_05320 [Planctomycetota bacterium]